MQQGSCLVHYHCPAHVLVFARAAITYTIACLAYLVLTRSIGTPFGDSLTAEQRLIKRTSSARRAQVFFASVVLSAVVVKVWRPLRAP
jgi:hypothetical protein